MGRGSVPERLRRAADPTCCWSDADERDMASAWWVWRPPQLCERHTADRQVRDALGRERREQRRPGLLVVEGAGARPFLRARFAALFAGALGSGVRGLPCVARTPERKAQPRADVVTLHCRWRRDQALVRLLPARCRQCASGATGRCCRLRDHFNRGSAALPASPMPTLGAGVPRWSMQRCECPAQLRFL